MLKAEALAAHRFRYFFFLPNLECTLAKCVVWNDRFFFVVYVFAMFGFDNSLGCQVYMNYTKMLYGSSYVQVPRSECHTNNTNPIYYAALAFNGKLKQ